jgi:uncharacterized protein YecE (DUF72 family)
LPHSLLALNVKQRTTPVLVGTAGWSLPRVEQPHFGEGASHLERYASRFPAAEINSSFHGSHRPAIWARWRDAVPQHFRFSVKMPKTITHTARLVEAGELTAAFLGEVELLEAKLGCLLVQLPPSLAFAAAAEPGGWRGLSYFRLHGSPKIYYSAYSATFLATLAARLRRESATQRPAWCIFETRPAAPPPATPST